MNPERTVRARVARDKTVVFAGKSSLTLLSRVTAAPIETDPDPIDTLLGALAADLFGCLGRALTRRRIALDELECTVTAALESPMVAVGVVGEEGSPALSTVTVAAFASTSGTDEAVQEAWADAVRTCCLAQTLAKSTNLITTLRHL